MNTDLNNPNVITELLETVTDVAQNGIPVAVEIDKLSLVLLAIALTVPVIVFFMLKSITKTPK